jgi:hypothetical protein
MQAGYTSVFLSDAPVRELYPGIRLRSLWTGPTGAHPKVLEMEPGATWPCPDLHEPGPKELYLIAGTFSDGAREYPAGTFLHAPAGSWHVPGTTTGCTLFLSTLRASRGPRSWATTRGHPQGQTADSGAGTCVPRSSTCAGHEGMPRRNRSSSGGRR